MKIKAVIVSISGLLISSLLSITSSAVTFPDIDGVKQGRVPYLVALWTVDSKTNARKDLYCTGVLIDRFHFLTAAHCLDIREWFVAVGGVTDASQRGQTLIVTDYELHPRYDAKSYQNDIAIARLYYGVDNAAEWGKFIGRYPTIPRNDKEFRKDMRLFGWGLKQNERPSYVVTSVPQTEFKSEAGKAFKTFNEATMLGAGFWYPSEKLYAGACNGDSGGPLLANESTKPTLIGLVSYGSAKGCDVKKPTVYTRVAYYKPWIDRTITKMKREWDKKGIVRGANPSDFSLPAFSSRFIESEYDKGTASQVTSVRLSRDPDAGRADMNEMMLQVYSDTIGINLYLSNRIDGCLLRQKGYTHLQVATNSFQDIDFELFMRPGTGCFRNGSSITAYDVKTPPKNFSGSCAVRVEPFEATQAAYKSNTDIDALSFQFDSRCLGKATQIWVRAVMEIDDSKYEADIEPGNDMWVGPLNPRGRG